MSLSEIMDGYHKRRLDKPKDRKLTTNEKATFDKLTEILWHNIPQHKMSDEYQRGDGEYYFSSLHDFGYFADGLEADLIPSAYIFRALVRLSDLDPADLTSELRQMYDFFIDL